MFVREHHIRIAVILEALDAQILEDHSCLFGGGTAMALRFGEYRESLDVDFLVSDREGYRALRRMLVQPNGFQSLARPGIELKAAREVRADQYGIRTVFEVGTAQIKFEIVLEARIDLEPPGEADRVCGIATLTSLDTVASKLLANSDRWGDRAVLSRDVIDLAMMGPSKILLRQGLDKAATAYASVEDDLHKAVDYLKDRPARLEECRQALQMTIPRAVLLRNIKRLTSVLGRNAT